ncbi:MAG: ubiquinol-cytochrome c reductase iron-sulfur subunit, partial [Pseudomonadota bacterium]
MSEQASAGKPLGLASEITSGESFSMPKGPESARRNWMIACGGAATVAGATVAVPFLGSMAPSDRAKSAGAPVEVDIGDIPAGGVK